MKGNEMRYMGWKHIILLISIVLLVSGCMNKKLTIEEAQKQMEIILCEVFDASSQDNFIVQVLQEKVEIRVDKIKKSGKTYLVDCVITSADLSSPVVAYFEDLNPNDVDDYDNVIQNLKSVIRESETVQKNFQVEFSQMDGEYQVTVPEEMMVFCSGNIQELLPRIYEILQGGVGQ